MNRIMAGFIPVLVGLVFTPSAFGWTHPVVVPSCPETHITTLSTESGSWEAVAKTANGTQIWKETIPGSFKGLVTIGKTYLPSDAGQLYSVEVYNKANHSDGYTKAVAYGINCAPPEGQQGPPGPQGPPGIGMGCDGQPVFETAPLCPGSPGADGKQGIPGTTVVIDRPVPSPEKKCKPTRHPHFRVIGNVRLRSVFFEGSKRGVTVKQTSAHRWRITVNFRKVKKIQGDNIVTVLRVNYTDSHGKEKTRVHYIRVCTGNINGGYGEGMNARTVIRL